MKKNQTIISGKTGFRFLMWFFILSGFSSCVAVKEYQKMYINDSEMQLALRKTEIPEMHFMLYREGSSGANGGKTGGGCGCN